MCPHAPAMPRQIGCWNDNKVIVVYTVPSRSCSCRLRCHGDREGRERGGERGEEEVGWGGGHTHSPHRGLLQISVE